MIVRAVIEWDEEARAYSATCPELNFVSSFGNTKEQAIANQTSSPNLNPQSEITSNRCQFIGNLRKLEDDYQS